MAQRKLTYLQPTPCCECAFGVQNGHVLGLRLKRVVGLVADWSLEAEGDVSPVPQSEASTLVGVYASSVREALRVVADLHLGEEETGAVVVVVVVGTQVVPAGAERVLGRDVGAVVALMGQEDDRVREEFFLTASSLGQPTTYSEMFLYVMGSLISLASTSSSASLVLCGGLLREVPLFSLLPPCSQRGALTPDTLMPGRLGPSPTRRGRPSDSDRHDFGTDLCGRLFKSSLNGHFLWHS